MSEKMTDEFWDEIFADMAKPLAPGEKTVSMVCQQFKCSDHTARIRIRRLVDEGRLEAVGKRLVNGRPAYAWRVAKKKNKN